jgi:group I intron endonuclease
MIESVIKYWDIYKITSPTGRVYVGLTCRLHQRIKDYGRLSCASQKILYNSFTKYGFPAHTIEAIDGFESDVDYAYGKEMFWIRTMMSNRIRFPEIGGMNISNGGRGISVLGKQPTSEKRSARRHSEETKLKMSKSHQGMRLTQREAVVKPSRKKLGNKPPKERAARGSSEHIEKMRGLGGRPIVQSDAKTSNQIAQYYSVSEAARVTKIRRTTICKVLYGKYRHTHGFVFKYKNIA